MLPAQAGMILSCALPPLVVNGAPRASGDDPGRHARVIGHGECSPRKRG